MSNRGALRLAEPPSILAEPWRKAPARLARCLGLAAFEVVQQHRQLRCCTFNSSRSDCFAAISSGRAKLKMSHKRPQ